MNCWWENTAEAIPNNQIDIDISVLVVTQNCSIPGTHFGILQYSHLLFLFVVKHQGRFPEICGLRQ